MPGHATGNRMNRILHTHSTRFEQVAQFTDCVLSLSRSHSISRYKDYLIGIGELYGDIVRTYLTHHAIDCACSGNFCAECAKKDVGYRAVHRPAHENGKNEAGESIECTGNN